MLTILFITLNQHTQIINYIRLWPSVHLPSSVTPTYRISQTHFIRVPPSRYAEMN